MEVLALPGSLTDCKSKLLEATLQRVPFAALAPRRRVKLYNLHQIFSNQARQCGVSFNGNLANPFHQIIRQRKSDIHEPIIRGTLILWQLSFEAKGSPLAERDIQCYAWRIKGESTDFASSTRLLGRDQRPSPFERGHAGNACTSQDGHAEGDSTMLLSIQ